MNASQRDFKGVWIPKHIWLNKELGWTEKLLLVEIESLDRTHGCFATNEYFATFFGLSKDRISKMITALKRKGYISVQLLYKDGTKQIDKRIIHVLGDYADTSSHEHTEATGEQTTPSRQAHLLPLGENSEENNTSFTNTKNNTRKKRIYEEHEEPMVLAKYLYALIERNNPYARKPNFQLWANDIRLMHEIDNIDYRVIQNCIRWCQQDNFWHKHILSAKKLREKFPTLYLQANEKGGQSHGTAQHDRAPESYADGIDF